MSYLKLDEKICTEDKPTNDNEKADNDEKGAIRIMAIELKFDLLKKEIFTFKLECSSAFIKKALRNFVLAMPIICDIGFDLLLFFKYRYGAHYYKIVPYPNHPWVNNSNSDYCILQGKTPKNEYEFSCFEKDLVFSWITLVSIMLPGVYLYICLPLLTIIDDARGKEAKVRRKLCIKVCSRCLPHILLCLLSPVIIIILKLLRVFIHGKQFKHMLDIIGHVESSGESTPQLILQMYIILYRADRRTKWWQNLSVITSIVSIALPRIQTLQKIRKVPVGGVKTEMLFILKYLPLFVSLVLFRVLSIAMMFVFLKYWTYLYYIILWYLSNCAFRKYVGKKNLLSCPVWDNIFTISHFGTTNSNRKHRRFYMLFWMVMNTTSLLIVCIICNLVARENLPSITVAGDQHFWNELYMVDDITILNFLIPFTIGCGFMSCILCFYQLGY